MSRFTTSQPTRPRYESAPYRPSPARREAIYGRIRPMNEPSKREWVFLVYGLLLALLALGFFAVPS